MRINSDIPTQVEQLSARLKYIMKVRSIETRQELAKKAGIPLIVLNQIMQKNQSMSESMLWTYTQEIADNLGLNDRWLWEGIEPKEI